MQRAGNKVHANVQLIDARTDTQLWANSYERELKDLFTVESEIAEEIAEALKANLSPRELHVAGRGADAKYGSVRSFPSSRIRISPGREQSGCRRLRSCGGVLSPGARAGSKFCRRRCRPQPIVSYIGTGSFRT